MGTSAKTLECQLSKTTINDQLQELTNRINELHEILAELVEHLTTAREYRDY
jgi:hypothetical protein